MEAIAKSSCTKEDPDGDESLPTCLSTAYSLGETSTHSPFPLPYVRTLGEPPAQSHFSTATISYSHSDIISHPHEILLAVHLVGYPWLELILQLRDTMSLIKADLGSVCARVRSFWISSTTPTEPPFISSTSLCTGELNSIRNHNCFLCSPFYVKGVSLGYNGRIKIKDPKDQNRKCRYQNLYQDRSSLSDSWHLKGATFSYQIVVEHC